MSGLADRPTDHRERADSQRRDTPSPAVHTEHDHDLADVRAVLEKTLRYSRERNYTGWDYADGSSSRILRALPFDNKWVNIAFQETIKRAPVNIRPYLLVEQRRNYKGTALFTMANLNTYRLTDDERYEREGRQLADWLVENRTPGYSGYCGAHRHRIQHLNHRGYPDDPDVVSTSYGVKALLQASSLDDEYATLTRTAQDFVLEDLNYTEIESGARIEYVPPRDDDGYTLNAVALGARLLVDLHTEFGDESLVEQATKLLDYVVSNQTERGGWTYRDPPNASHLSMDSFHNGFIIETLLRYQEVIDPTNYEDALARALNFYRDVLFEPDGAPNWDESNSYPRDVHAATQGILVFSRVGDLRFAGQIIEWLFDTLYAGDGQFYFRKQRFYTKRMTLMRWCQAWVSYALSNYLLRAHRVHPPTRTDDLQSAQTDGGSSPSNSP